MSNYITHNLNDNYIIENYFKFSSELWVNIHVQSFKQSNHHQEILTVHLSALIFLTKTQHHSMVPNLNILIR